MANVTTLLDARSVPEAKPALVCPSHGTSLSYLDLRESMNRVGNGLLRLGVRKGDRVCIYLDSSPEYLISYFASWRIGAVAVPTSIVYRGEELLHALTDAGAVAVITDRSGAAVVREVGARAPSLAHAVVVGGSGEGVAAWDDLLECSPELRAAYCACDDLCQLQYTSGTTGRPKGAMLTHGNWMSALDAEREALRMAPDDVYLGIYPMGHVGVSWGLAALRSGATWVMMERFDLEQYLALCREHRVTVLPSLWETFDRRFRIPVANSYGLSETIVIGSGTTTLPGYPHLTRNYTSVGVPVGYTEVRIVDPEDPERELPAGETGEIALRGPSVARGYWNLPGETAAVFREEGWFLTGDIGHLDPDGLLYVTDRKKDMIIMSGWKVYPTEVENVLLQHPAVLDAAVFGVPDERRGEIPVAAVVVKEGCTVTGDEIEDYCRSRMAGYKVPRRLVLVPVLPRVNGWKLLRRTLREQFAP